MELTGNFGAGLLGAKARGSRAGKSWPGARNPRVDPIAAGARGLAQLIAGRGPAAPLGTAKAVNTVLITQAKRARNLIPRLTELDVDLSEVRVGAVSRADWLDGASSAAQRTIGDVSGLPEVPLVPLIYSFMARNVMGQYEPITDTIMLVSPNLYHFEREYGLEREELALWTAAHEFTHAAQYRVAPWIQETLAGYVISGVNKGDKKATENINALMSLLEGHAEYIMNTVPHRIVPSRRRLDMSMLDRRNRRSRLQHVFECFGLNSKAEQYQQGRAFVQAVVAQVGLHGLNQVWEKSENAPTLYEIYRPSLWVERVVYGASEEEAAENSQGSQGVAQ